MRKMSEKGKKFLVQLEGMRKKMYFDSAGYPTIGVGHLLTKDENSSGKIEVDGKILHWRYGLLERHVYELLSQDLEPVEDAVHIRTPYNINQNQFDALVSFTFNVGIPAFARSTLLKRIRAGSLDEVLEQFRRWRFVGGREIPGSVNRREEEIQMWKGVWV